MAFKIDEKHLKSLIKETIKEAISSEFMKLRASLLPYVSEKEQEEIEKLYKKPSRKVKKSFRSLSLQI